MARNSNSGWTPKVSAILAAIIILGGVAVSLGFGVRLRTALENNEQSRMTTASVALQLTVDEQLARYIDTVRLAAAGLTAGSEPTASAFREVTTAVASQQLTAVEGIRLLVPATPDDDLAAVRSRWAARGAAGLELAPAHSSQQYLFTVYARGLGGRSAPPVGVDQSAAPAEVEVARLARTGNGVAISDAYVLLADRKAAKPQMSFDVAAPVYDGRVLAGYIALSVGGTDFVTMLLKRAAGGLLDAELLTRSASGSLTTVAAVLHAGRGQDVRYAQDFETGRRQWVLRTSTDNKTLLPTAGRTDMVVVLAGSVLSVMFGTLMYLQMSATKRMEREIEVEVAERLEAAGERVEEKEEEPAR